MHYYKTEDGYVLTAEQKDLPEVLPSEIDAFFGEFEKECQGFVDYDELVNKEIRKRYSESQEFAILRQRDTKPQEYKEYFNYCEECKRTIKEEMGVK